MGNTVPNVRLVHHRFRRKCNMFVISIVGAFCVVTLYLPMLVGCITDSYLRIPTVDGRNPASVNIGLVGGLDLFFPYIGNNHPN